MELLNDLLEQITNIHTGLMLVLAVLITGYVVKSIPQIPNQFIPLITLFVAMSGNYLMGDTGAVSPYTSNPKARLVFVGILYWGIGWLLHNQGLSRLEPFLPAPIRALIGVKPEVKPPAAVTKNDIIPLP